MKKLTRLPAGMILPLIVLLTVVFFSPQKVNAQTDPECYRAYQNEEYKCLQTRTKCIQSCSSVNNLKACQDSCSAQDKLCSNQASADLKACLAAIPKEGTKVSTEANAQPKNITCEEWKKIVGTDKCKYAVVTSTVIGDAINPRRDPPSSIWCSDTVDIGDTYINLPVDYKYATSEEKCIFDAQTEAYERQTEKSADRASQTTSQETKTPKTPPVFIGEWFSRFSKVTEALIALPEAMVNVVYEDKLHLAGDFPKLSKMSLEDFYQGHWYPNEDDSVRPATITAEDEQEAWEEFLPIYIPDEENITVVKGQGEMKTPTLSEFIPITPKGGDTLQVTYLDSTVRSTSDAVQLRYAWSPDSGAVINIPQSAEIKFLEPVTDEKTQEIKRMLKLNKGELEVKIKNTNQKNKFEVQAGSVNVVAPRTHFWISQSQDKKIAVIGVYEGEVEVKTKDGKTVKVKPDGDKPGVVVVTQKLSVARLAVIGVVLAIIIGGITMILRRKFAPKGFSKKKK